MPYANYQDTLNRAKFRYEQNPDYHREKAARWAADNKYRKRWLDQRATSKARGVEFNLTFEEWMEFWGDDVDRRGIKSNDLCMGRYDDAGAYEIGNIYKCTNAENKLGPQSKPDEGMHPDIPF